MNREVALLLLCSVVGCSRANGFEIPKGGTAGARLVGRAIGPDRAPAVGASVFLVIDDVRVAHTTTGDGGSFVIESPPAGYAQVVVNAGRGIGAVRALQIYAGGTNDAGEILLGQLYLDREILSFRGVDAEERWTEGLGPFRVLRWPLFGDWSIAERYGYATNEEDRVAGISLATAEVRTLVELSSSLASWPVSEGIVNVDRDENVSWIGVDGSRREGPRLLGTGQLHSRMESTEERAIYARGSIEDPLLELFLLDLESLESRSLGTMESVGPYSFDRLDELVTRPPVSVRIGRDGEQVLIGRRVDAGGGQVEERLTALDTTTLVQTDLWAAACPVVDSDPAARCLTGFDLEADGSVIAAVSEGASRRYLRFTPDHVESELDLRDPSHGLLETYCLDPSVPVACRPSVLWDGAIRLETPIRDRNGNVVEWLAGDFVDQSAVRALELGASPYGQADGQIVASAGGELEALTRRASDGFLQIYIGPARGDLDLFEQRTFLPEDHWVVGFSADLRYVYYHLRDPESGSVELFRVFASELGDDEERGR
jgi:hypothetical protein